MSLFALALAATLSVSDPAAESEKDMRCVVVISHAYKTADPEARIALAASAMYFIGRIEGREPGYDFNVNFTRMRALPASDLIPDATRCASQLEALAERSKMIDAALGG